MAVPVDSLELAGRYFDALNARDPEAILASFEEGGWYSDPTTGGPPEPCAHCERPSG